MRGQGGLTFEVELTRVQGKAAAPGVQAKVLRRRATTLPRPFCSRHRMRKAAVDMPDANSRDRSNNDAADHMERRSGMLHREVGKPWGYCDP